MALLVLLPIALRLALLPHYPVPIPGGSDDFSYLLLGDTLSHFRLANPVHPMHRFFESIFVVQEPSYSSIFPLGQGFVLVFGWAGVLFTAGLFCALSFWMLRAWVAAPWALLGGLLAVAEFGPLCTWMNDYWGGSLSACAGCLVFGALPRLHESSRTRDAALLGVGIAIELLTRPFECLLLVLAIAIGMRKLPKKAAIVAASIPILLAASLTMFHNHAVTKSWTTLPYMLSRYQYGVPATFTFQPNPIPHRTLTQEQQLDYDAQKAVHGESPDTLTAYLHRLWTRASFYRFFLLVPLWIAPFALFRDRRFLWVLSVILIFALGTNFYPYFYPHYIAAEACLFLLIAVAGLNAFHRWGRIGRQLAQAVVILCATHFCFWYGLHLVGTEEQRATLTRFENWDFINYGDPQGRIAVQRRLDASPGRQLVFVRYWSQHGFYEWIHNAADIDSARVVWAADLGEDQDRPLRNYFPDRKAWLLEPDAHPPRLTPDP